MTTIDPRDQLRIQNHDPSIEVLWNNRTGRWVVVQNLLKTPHPRWMTVPDRLVGVQSLGEKSPYKVMFVCEEKLASFDNIPIKPTAEYVIARLERDTRRFGDVAAFKEIEATWDAADAKEEKDDEEYRKEVLEDQVVKQWKNTHAQKHRGVFEMGASEEAS